MGVINIIKHYHEGLLIGLKTTGLLIILVWALGLVGGAFVGSLAYQFPKSVGRLARLFSFLLSGIPVLVLLFWLHYPAQSLIHITVDPFWTSVLALGLVNIFSVADIVRPVIEQFPKQYVVAARVCGLSELQSIVHIRLPLILRQVTPSLLTAQVTILQATLFASLISVNEIFRVAQQINSREYRPVEIYTTLALFFLAICLPLNGFAIFLRNRFSNQDFSEK
jgi:polar amino acid transport system permease protein